MDYKVLLKTMTTQNASELHLRVNQAPVFKMQDKLLAAKMDPLSEDDLTSVMNAILTDEQKVQFNQTNDISGGFGISGIGRFQFRAGVQDGSPVVAFRHIKSK